MPKTTTTQEVFASPASGIEEELLRLAAATFEKVYADYSSLGGEGLIGRASRPGLTPQLQALVSDSQRIGLDNARAGLDSVYGDINRQVAEEAARRGVSDSSFTGVALGQAYRDKARDFAGIAAGSQQQASQQLFSGAFQDQAAAANLLSMRTQLGSLLSDPGLLGRMMQFRLSTARSINTQQTPRDWTQALGALGSFAGGLGLPEIVGGLFDKKPKEGTT